MSAERLLSGKNIVVTGAGQGIGRAYAHSAAKHGAQVFVTDINMTACKKVVSEIMEAGGRAEALELDVAEIDSCRNAAESVSGVAPVIHGLINNAAIFSNIRVKPFWDIEVAEWDRLMNVNLRGPFVMVKTFLELLRHHEGASIVNVSSDSFKLGRTGYLHYTASKAGIVGLTSSMARELGQFNIRVNAISPGPVYTEIKRDTVSPEQKKALHEAQSIARDAGPDDMVGLVVFLLSDLSRFITGQTISVNGGLVFN